MSASRERKNGGSISFPLFRKSVSKWFFLVFISIFIWRSTRYFVITTLNSGFYYITFENYRIQSFIGSRFFEVKMFFVFSAFLLFMWWIREKIVKFLRHKSVDKKIKIIIMFLVYSVVIVFFIHIVYRGHLFLSVVFYEK